MKPQAVSRKQQGTARVVMGLGLSAACLVLSGCVRRQLTIRSEPPGAVLIVNDEKLGTTPLTYDFMWYGWYRMLLTKPGYERLDDHVELKAPWYLWIPMDLAMELMPFTVRDDRQLSYTLSPLTPLPVPTPPVAASPPPPDHPTQRESHDPARFAPP